MVGNVSSQILFLSGYFETTGKALVSLCLHVARWSTCLCDRSHLAPGVFGAVIPLSLSIGSCWGVFTQLILYPLSPGILLGYGLVIPISKAMFSTRDFSSFIIIDVTSMFVILFYIMLSFSSFKIFFTISCFALCFLFLLIFSGIHSLVQVGYFYDCNLHGIC